MKEECIKGFRQVVIGFATRRRRVFRGGNLSLSARQEGMRLGSHVRWLAVDAGFAQHDVNRVVGMNKLGGMAAHGQKRKMGRRGNKSVCVCVLLKGYSLSPFGCWRDCENVVGVW